MDEDHSKEGAVADIDEGGVDAKEICVGELKHRAGDGRNDRDVRVSDAELVEVMEVGQAKNQGREEDDIPKTRAGDEEERHGGGAE